MQTANQKPAGNPFYEVVRGLLRERLALVMEGELPAFTDIRHLYYQARKIYKDLTGSDEAPGEYNNYIGAINKFCKKHSPEIGVPEAFWWLLRDKMNIVAKAMAICDGEAGRFLIDHETRGRVKENSSFILLCEKDTVSRELLEELRKVGYKVNLISSQGQNVADTKAAVISAVTELEKENFFILYLHDYDVSGVEMFFNLLNCYPKVIDIGVNEHFLKTMKISKRKVQERSKVKTQRRKLEAYTEEYNYSDIVDLDYICGKVDSRTGKRTGNARIIEIDNIHVYYGIKPFIKYIKLRLADIDCWDLSRIGVKEFELEEPENLYDSAVKDLEKQVALAYGKKEDELSTAMSDIEVLVKEALSQFGEFDDLEEKHRGRKGAIWSSAGPAGSFIFYEAPLKSEELDKLRDDYVEEINREWRADYDEELGEVNEEIECYPGDVVRGERTLKNRVKKLQGHLQSDTEEDPDLTDFEIELDDIDWGEEELDEIKLPDEEELLKTVISALQDRLEIVQFMNFSP